MVGTEESYKDMKDSKKEDKNMAKQKMNKTKKKRSGGRGSPLSGPPAAWPAATLHKKL